MTSLNAANLEIEGLKALIHDFNTKLKEIPTIQHSTSALVRAPAPVITVQIQPVRQVSVQRDYVEKIVSPPASRTRSKAKKKLPTALPTTTTTPPATPEENVKVKTPTRPIFKKCAFHTCSKQHKCPKAPPWPSQCSCCGIPCKQSAMVCNDCGSIICTNHPGFVGICSFKT